MLSSCMKSYSRLFLILSKIRTKYLTYESHNESFEKHKKAHKKKSPPSSDSFSAELPERGTHLKKQLKNVEKNNETKMPKTH